MDDFDLHAASLRADGADLAGWVEILAAKLEGALPSHCEVKRRRRGLVSGEKRVERVVVTLGARLFVLQRHGGEYTAGIESAVHDMRRRFDAVPLETWVTALEADLRERATSSAEARAALERLLGP